MENSLIQILGIFFITFLCFSCQQKESWTEIESHDGSIPEARFECGFVEALGKFYLIGGRGNKHIDIYDPKLNIWSKGAMPPVEIHHFQPVVFNGFILVVGAMTGNYPNEQPISNVLIYHPLEDQWYVDATIPLDRVRGSGGTVIYNHKIYWAGGIRNGHIGDHKDFFDEYDPITKEWRILSNLPQGRDHFQAAVFQDKLYIAGGRRSKAPFGTLTATITDVDVYDFESETWTTLEHGLPHPRAGTMSIIFDDKLLVSGGETNTEAYAHRTIDALELSSLTWTDWSELPIGRHGTGMINWEDRLYTSGGSFQHEAGYQLNDLWVYTK